MNHQALGDFVAYRQQASDAADRRFALLICLSITLSQKARQPDQPMSGDDLTRQLDDAITADEEFIAALDCTNLYAHLCGKQPMEPGDFGRPAFDTL